MTATMDKAAEAIRDQMQSMMKNLNLPNIDIATLIETQRKNVETMSRTAQLTTEVATEISHRQLEILRAASEQLASTLKDMKLSDDQRREIATKAFETASARAQEFADTTAKANREMFEAAKQRMTDNFDQIRKMFSGASG